MVHVLSASVLCEHNITGRGAQSTLVGVVMMFSKVFISGTISPLPVGIVRISTDAHCL